MDVPDFAYVKGLNSKAPKDTPILLAPMYGDGLKFNTDAYEGKAVVLRIDGAVKQYRLSQNRAARNRKGELLFHGGADTAWGEKGFDQSQLCYAKYPYDFQPKVRPVNKLIYWGVGAIVLLLILYWIGRRRQKKVDPMDLC